MNRGMSMNYMKLFIIYESYEVYMKIIHNMKIFIYENYICLYENYS